MENGGVEMLNELYGENQIPPERHLQQCDITLGIDTTNIPQTQSKYWLEFAIRLRELLCVIWLWCWPFVFLPTIEVKKTMTEDEAEKVRQQNEEVRNVRETKASEIAD